MERGQSYSRDDAIAAFGGATRVLAEGFHVLTPRAVLCFFDAGHGPTASRFASRQTFVWRVPPDLVAASGDRTYRWLAAELRDATQKNVAIALFVRPPGDDRYVLVSERAHLASYGSDREACFSLDGVLPVELAVRFGSPSLPPGAPLVGRALASAVREADTTERRFALVQRFYESWYGPLMRDSIEEGPEPRAVREWAAWWKPMQRAHRTRLACQPMFWRLRDGVFVFQSEEQGVVRWGVREKDAGDADPPVVLECDGKWSAGAGSVSQCALQLTIYFSVRGGAGVHGWTGPPPGAARAAIAKLAPLGFPDWPWPAKPMRLYTHERGIVSTCGARSALELTLLTRDEHDWALVLDDLDLADLPWEVHHE
jgi:hypothetical protein